MEVKSVLMSTAKSLGYREDGASPWTAGDIGSGRAQVDRAAAAGLTVDETFQGFLDADANRNNVEYSSLFLNRFSPAAADVPYRLNSVQILWPDTAGLLGKVGDLQVYLDVDGDGDPANAPLIAQQDFSISAANQFQSISLNLTVDQAGDLYIEFRDSWAPYPGGYQPALYPAALDISSTSVQCAWVVAISDNSTPNINDLGNNSVLGVIDSVTGGSFVGNWLIRAQGETLAG